MPRLQPDGLTKAIPNAKLRAVRQERGLSQSRLAEMVNASQGDIAKLESGSKRSTVDWLVRLATALECDPKDLMPASVEAPLLKLRGGDVAVGPRGVFRNTRPNAELIPVRSAVRGGDQEMFLHDGPIDWVPRPPSLLNVLDPYALYMVGESMLPRFRPGQLLFVNPHRPITPGMGAVVTKTNNGVLVKEYVAKTAAMLRLLQYNPDRSIELTWTEVADVHTIVGVQEP